MTKEIVMEIVSPGKHKRMLDSQREIASVAKTSRERGQRVSSMDLGSP